MSLWDWLFGSKKDVDFGTSSRMASTTSNLRSTPVAPAVATSAHPPPGMQQLQLAAPAAVPTSYGIQRAIELMRALPIDDDPALVLRVVRKTLRSTGVSLEEIVTTAGEREAAVIRGIESDRAAIEQLEIQIATRKANITRLEGDLEETRDVRARIEEALASETKVGNALNPEEVMRIRAEAAQRASKAPPVPAAPPPPPKIGPPAIPSRPPPKLPSAVSAPVPKPKVEAPKAEAPKAEAPKVEPPKVEAPKIETKPEPPKEEAKSDAKNEPGARSGPMSSIPDLGEIDDGFEETTATREIPIPSEAVGKDGD